jgi:hypothetical protein
MASTIPPVLVQLVADVTQLKSGLAQAEASLKGLDDSVKKSDTGMKNFTSQIKKVGVAMGVTFAAAKVTGFFKESVLAASNFNEALSKVNVVFQQNSKEIETWAKGSIDSFGMSERGALTAAGNFGALFTAFGLGAEDTKNFSQDLTELAVDMASFNDMSVDDAMNALRSGLSGETEPMKKFGSVLSDVRLKTQAFEMGLIRSTKEALDPAAKAQAAYALIMKDTIVQQGDYQRTSDGTANTMRRVQESMDNAKVAIGQGLLPIFDALLLIMEKGIVPIFTTFGNFLNNNQASVKAFGIVLLAGVTIWGAYTIAVNLATIAQKALNAAQRINPMLLIITAVALLIAGMVKLFNSNQKFRDIVIAVAKVAINAFASIIPMVGKVFEAIAKVGTGPLRLLLLALSKLPGIGKYAKAGLDIMNKGLDNISDFADGAAKKATELVAKLDKVGKVAKGTKEKVDTALGGTGGGNTGKGGKGGMSAADKNKLADYKKDVTSIYKDMNDEIISAKEEAAKELTRRDEKIAAAHLRYSDVMEAAQQDRDRSEASARKRNTEVLIEIEQEYAKKTADIEKNKNKQLADLQEAASKKRAELTKTAAEKEQSVVKQSIDRLRSAFASKLSFNLADSFDLTAFTSSLSIKTAEGWTTAFSTAAKKGTDKLLSDLKAKLQGAKDLQENAAKLAGMGYSQTFIEEVVKNGPEAGNKIAAALQAASPDATKELQDLYGQVEKISETGLDKLAATMNSGGKLATQELMTAYSQVAVDLKQSLAEVDSELNKSLADANAAYSEAMSEAQANRTEKMAAAMTDLQEALAAAKLRFDDTLAEATRDLQRSLASAQKDYQDAIDEINKATQKKLEDLKLKLAEVAAAMSALGASQAAYAAMQNAPVYKPIVAATLPKTGSSSGGSGGTTTNITTNVTGVNLSDPYATTTSVVNAIKFGNVVVPIAPSKLASGESGAIGAASIAARTKTLSNFSYGSGNPFMQVK